MTVLSPVLLDLIEVVKAAYQGKYKGAHIVDVERGLWAQGYDSHNVTRIINQGILKGVVKSDAMIHVLWLPVEIVEEILI